MTELLELGSVWRFIEEAPSLCVDRWACHRRRPMITFEPSPAKPGDDNWYMYLTPAYFTPKNVRQWF
jgi:hypothetical protein